MKTRRVLFSATVTAMLAVATLQTSGQALAADKEDLLPGGIASWQGFYLGAQSGWTRSRGKDKKSGTKLNQNAWEAGIHAGYNWQMDDLLFGFEVDANPLGFTKKKRRGPFAKAYLTQLSTARLRVGKVFGSNLLYGTGGLSFGAGEIKTGSKTKDKLHTGWVLGAGVEHMFTPSWSLRAEYLYHNYGAKDYKFSTGTRRISFDDSHSLRLGVSYHF